MPTKPKSTAKNVDLGPLLVPRVKRIASLDPVLKTDIAVIRAAVVAFAEAWEESHARALGQGAGSPPAE